MSLGPQLRVDHDGTGPPAPEKFAAVENRDAGWPKPKNGGGLWTSTHGARGCWLDWMRCEQWAPGDTPLDSFACWLLDVAPEARVYTIDSYADLAALVERFPGPGILGDDDRAPDWEAVAAEGWHGVHLTDTGQWATRLSYPLSLYGWDCESTLWLTWAFTNWREIGYAEALAAIPADEEEEAVA